MASKPNASTPAKFRKLCVTIYRASAATANSNTGPHLPPGANTMTVKSRMSSEVRSGKEMWLSFQSLSAL